MIVSEIPEGLEEHYTENDEGQFVLDVDGLPKPDTAERDTLQVALDDAKGKVAQFRKTNVTLMKQIKDQGGNVDDNYQVDIETTVNEALAPIKEKNLKLEETNKQLQVTLEEVVLSDRVKDIAIKHGVHESALLDITSRARKVFTVKDGKPIPKDSKNSRDEDGNVLSPESWLVQLTESAPHLFKSSNGSGAQRSATGVIQTERTATQKIADGLQKV